MWFWYSPACVTISGRASPFRSGMSCINITFLFTLVPGKEGSIVHAGWTIGAQMLFYLIFPLLYWRMPRLRTKLLVLLIAVAIVTVVHHIPWPHGECTAREIGGDRDQDDAAVPCGDGRF